MRRAWVRALGGDHPRSRGVYPRPDPRERIREGSSPLARGLRLVELLRGAREGIIPARAGFTSRRVSSRVSFSWDHPRSRGVYGAQRRRRPASPGSSPLARGLPGGSPPHVRHLRIIPARAGFTRGRPGRPGWTPDHPRSRGVYRVSCFVLFVRLGSSPLARGLRDRRPRLRVADRIIPARAGFTRLCEAQRRRRPDHPRSRGVYRGIWDGLVNVVGSSPLARGLPSSSLRSEEGGTGIIPARAGFTPPRTRRRRPGRDHPRSRGVYSWPATGGWTRRGSSPLARGLL